MKLKPPKLPKLPLKIPDLKFFNLPKAKQKDVDTNLRFRAEPLLAAFQGKILTKYLVDQATVFIIDQEGNGIYTVSEPELNPEEQRIYSLLIENLFFTLKPLAKIEDSLKYVEGFIWDATEELGVVESVQKSFQKYRYFITRDAFGYGPIHIPMKDPKHRRDKLHRLRKASSRYPSAILGIQLARNQHNLPKRRHSQKLSKNYPREPAKAPQ